MKKIFVNSISVIIITLYFMLLFGCAGPRQVTLYYPPKEYVETEQSVMHVVKLSKPHQIVLNFADKRLKKDRIGNVQNTYGRELGNVYPINDPVKWVEDAVKMELKRRRYSLFDTIDVNKSDSIPILSVEINQIYCKAHWVYEGVVSLTVRMLLCDDSTVIEKTYSGTGSAGENLGATAEGCAKTFVLALSDLSNKLSNDIYSVFVSQYLLSYRSMKSLKDSISARAVAYRRVAASLRARADARAAALAKAAKFEKMTKSTRMVFYLKEAPDKSKSDKKETISYKREIGISLGILATVIAIIMLMIL